MTTKVITAQSIERFMPKSEGTRIAAAVAAAVILGVLIALLAGLKG